VIGADYAELQRTVAGWIRSVSVRSPARVAFYFYQWARLHFDSRKKLPAFCEFVFLFCGLCEGTLKEREELLMPSSPAVF
jgi:hypothetical protein